MQRNEAFFRTHEAYFLAIKESHGEDEALNAMKKVMERNLGAAYDKMGFKKWDPHDFARVVGERDASVGLRVEFPVVSDKKIVYRFYDDPFPGLKGRVECGKLDATYMEFKVNHLLGSGWAYRTTKHLWNGDKFTEHVIEKGP